MSTLLVNRHNYLVLQTVLSSFLAKNLTQVRDKDIETVFNLKTAMQTHSLKHPQI